MKLSQLQRSNCSNRECRGAIVNVEEVNNNVIDSVDDTRHTLNDEHRKIVERLNEIMLKGKTSDGIMFTKVDKFVGSRTDRIEVKRL